MKRCIEPGVKKRTALVMLIFVLLVVFSGCRILIEDPNVTQIYENSDEN